MFNLTKKKMVIGAAVAVVGAGTITLGVTKLMEKFEKKEEPKEDGEKSVTVDEVIEENEKGKKTQESVETIWDKLSDEEKKKLKEMANKEDKDKK